MIQNKKKAIFIMTFTRLWGKIANSLSENHDIEPVLYVGMPHYLEVEENVLKNTRFYSLEDARLGIKPNFQDFKPKTLSPKLLKTFSKNQVISYEMMSRFLISKRDGNFLQRRKYLWEIYRIWEGIFECYQPDVIFGGSLPHRVFDDVVYNMCQKYDIPYLSLDMTTIREMTYVSSSRLEKSKIFKKKLESNRKLPVLSKTMEDYFNYVRHPDENYKPFNISAKGRFSETRTPNAPKGLKALVKDLPQPFQIAIQMFNEVIKGTLGNTRTTVFTYKDEDYKHYNAGIPVTNLQMLKLRAMTWNRVRQAKDWYEKHQSEPDFSNPYIYFPANYQPERSTVPNAQLYYDFGLILKMLEKTVPADWNIFYKEHPRSFMMPFEHDNPRDIDHYIRIKEACPRVKFLSPKANSINLIKHCRAVAVASGTTGWEAVSRGKPVLSFGEYWYIYCQGVFRIESLKDLQNAIQIVQKYKKTDENNIKDYLAAVQSICKDFSYYFRDNVEERLFLGSNQNREFSEDEKEFRERLADDIADYFSQYLDK